MTRLRKMLLEELERRNYSETYHTLLHPHSRRFDGGLTAQRPGVVPLDAEEHLDSWTRSRSAAEPAQSRFSSAGLTSSSH